MIGTLAGTDSTNRMSATVHVLVGQCGNQLGATFLNALCKEAGADEDCIEYEEGEYQTGVAQGCRFSNGKRHSMGGTAVSCLSSCSLQASTRTMSAAAYHHRVSRAHFRLPLSSSAAWSAGGGGGDHSATSSGPPRSADTLPEPRCVLVDMEPQVVTGLLRYGGGRNRWRDEENVEEEEEEEEGSESRDEQVEILRRGMASSQSTAHNGQIATAQAQEERENRAGSSISLPSRCPALFQYSPQQCATRCEGSGNNWAYGYLNQGESRREAIEDCLAREMEATDAVIHTYHVVHSLAGGTGSGVGSLVGEVVKDMQPHCCSLLHSVVWPFSNGEVVTQWYNLCCTVQSLKENADGIQVMFNDFMLDRLTAGESLSSHFYNGGSGGAGGVITGISGMPQDSGFPVLPSSSFSHRASCTTTTTSTSSTFGSCRRTPRGYGNVQRRDLDDYTSLNAGFTDVMIPLHIPQYLCPVPPPQPDLRKYRIPDLRGRESRRTGVGVHRIEPLRYVCTEDILEAVGAVLDPSMKFFTASAISPFLVSAGVAGGRRPLLCGGSSSSLNTLADTSWLGVLKEAERTAEEYYDNNPSSQQQEQQQQLPPTPSFSSFFLPPRRCLWCLRGPQAMTEGISTLQDILAARRSSPCRASPYSPPHAARSRGERTWSAGTTTARLATEPNRCFSSARVPNEALAGPALEENTFPLSSLFVHPRPSFPSSGQQKVTSAESSCLPPSTGLRQSISTAVPLSVKTKNLKNPVPHLPSPRYEVHLYGPSPHIGIQADYAASRAEQLLRVNAFVHHYTKYGLEKSFLKEAVATTYEIATIYRQA